MKIIIEKFGPIDKFEYDLDKELIITYGNNNIGKSYAMQIVYLMLKTFIANMFITPRAYHPMYLYPRHIDVSLHKEKIENMIRTFIESKDLIKDITSDIVLEVNKLISVAFMPEFMNSCKNTFGNLEKTLVKEPVITIIYREYHFVFEPEKWKNQWKNKYKTGTIKKDRF